ncbi:MAG: hydrogenase maturation protease [Candidatus Omnitrophota bacterium]
MPVYKVSSIAVIGLGNTLRRDDGIGIIILESLLKFYPRPDIDYLDFGIASFDLIHRMQEYDKVLLIDGINAGLEEAQLKIFKLEDIEYTIDGPVISTHEINLKGIFELYKKLELKTKIYVAGIQVKDTSFGEGLTEVLNKDLKNIVEKINFFIDGM